MSSLLGYPDFQKPRDWLAGLVAQQQLFSRVLPIGGTLLYTVAAGKTVVFTRLFLQISLAGNGAAGIFSDLIAEVDADNGLDGASALIDLQVLALRATANGENSAAADLVHAVPVQGGAGGNPIRGSVSSGISGNFSVIVIGYGALLN